MNESIPTPPTPAGAGTETASSQFSSNPHDHGMVPETFSPPGFTSWRLRTNEEWVALTKELRRQAEADRANNEALKQAMLNQLAKHTNDHHVIEALRTQLATYTNSI